jgi:hypothetical protein
VWLPTKDPKNHLHAKHDFLYRINFSGVVAPLAIRPIATGWFGLAYQIDRWSPGGFGHEYQIGWREVQSSGMCEV